MNECVVYLLCLGNKLYKMHGTYMKKISHSLQFRRSRKDAPCVSKNRHGSLYAGDRQICFYPHIFRPACTADYPLNYTTQPCSTLCCFTPSHITLHGDTHNPLSLLRLAKQPKCHYAHCDVDRKCLPAYILNDPSVV